MYVCRLIEPTRSLNISQNNRGYLLLSDAALGIQPVMELPKDLLTTLSSNNVLKSWQIFDERNMDIVVKLCFAGGHCSQAEVTTARYRRKAPAQVKRDQARSATYKQQQHAQRTADPSTVDKQPCLSRKAHVLSWRRKRSRRRPLNQLQNHDPVDTVAHYRKQCRRRWRH